MSIASLVTSENRKWWTLGAVALGLFMIMLDNTVVNVALPTIQRDLDAGLPELEWIVSGYALTFAALLLTGGKLADLLGRRLMFVTGLGDLRRLVARLRARADRGVPDRGARRPGRRRGAHEPGHALDHHGSVPAAAARHGDRDLGRRLGVGARHRPARRRAADRARRLELDLLRQRADRDRRDRRRPAADRRDEGHLARAAPRPARPRHVGARPLRAHLRADRGEHLRLELRPHRRRLRGRRRRRSRPSSCSSCASACPCSTSPCSAAAPSRAPTRSSCS